MWLMVLSKMCLTSTSEQYEVNLVGSNPKEWWIDIGATHHVCSDKKIFSTFEPFKDFDFDS